MGGLQLWKLVGLLVAVIPGKALLPFRLQGQCCIASGVAVRILEVVASPVRRSTVRICRKVSSFCAAIFIVSV